MQKFLIFLSIFIVVACSGCNNKRAVFERASLNAEKASEGFIRCHNYTQAWLKHADDKTGLIPRNLQKDSGIWNAKDAAADNYPFMVLSSFFTDHELFQGRMLDMLRKEEKLTSRIGALPDVYSFEKNGFLYDEVNLSRIIFGASEYMKDGLLPLYEWLGASPWSVRMLDLLNDLSKQVGVLDTLHLKTFGNKATEEVNGELLQVLTRMYWTTGNKNYLNWAVNIGDHYLLYDKHPTRNSRRIRLRDHGCELIAGLSELYATVSEVMPQKRKEYKEPLHEMLNKILETGRNEHGMFYDEVNPLTGDVISQHLADTWGYILNAFYTVYMIDDIEPYRHAVLKVFNNLPLYYKEYDWEYGSSDGYADAIESALNLHNREHDEEVGRWIDEEIQHMWNIQQPSGIIEGWHGDGNFARTSVMYCLWKTQGTYIRPWRKDVKVGAVRKRGKVFITLKADKAWKGKLFFDKPRHKVNMNLPFDWPRINQFPEWFTVNEVKKYSLYNHTNGNRVTLSGSKLINGWDISIEPEVPEYIEISE